MAVQTADYVWRDYETDGVTASGNHKPILREIRALITYLQNGVTGAAAGATIYDSKADMVADTSQAANAMAWVLGDVTAANNGVYQFNGTSTWTRLGDLPYSYIKASNAGAGTANAIVATTSIPIPAADGAALIALPIAADNTASPVTVAFNGGTALTIKTSAGNDITIGGLTSGMIVAGYVSGTTFRLLTDQSSAAVLAAAEAAAAQAVAAASSVQSTQVSRANAQTNYHPDAAPDFIQTAGYTSAGDGGGALYKNVASEPSHDGKFSITLSDEETVAWYEIAETVLTPEMLGGGIDGLNSALAVAETIGVAACQINQTYTAVSGNETIYMRTGVTLRGLSTKAIITRENDDLVGKLIDFDTYSADGAKLIGVTVDGNWADKAFTSSNGIIYVGAADDVEIAFCDIGNGVGAGVRVTDGLRFFVHHNIFRYTQAAQVSVAHTTDTTNAESYGRIENNEVFDPCFHAFYVSRHNRVQIRGNLIHGRLTTGLHVSLNGATGVLTWVSGPTFESIKPGEFVNVHDTSTGNSVECWVQSVDSSTQLTTNQTSLGHNLTNELAAAGSGDLINVSGKYCQIVGNYAEGGATGGVVIYSSSNNSLFCDGCLVEGNVLIAIGSQGVSFQGGNSTRWHLVTGNLVINPGARGAIGNSYNLVGVAISAAEAHISVFGNTLIDNGVNTMQYGIKAGSAAGNTHIGPNEIYGAVVAEIYNPISTPTLGNWGTGATVDNIVADGHRISMDVTAGSGASGSPQITVSTYATPRAGSTAGMIVMLWDGNSGTAYLGKATGISNTGFVANFGGAGITLTSGRVYHVTIYI